MTKFNYIYTLLSLLFLSLGSYAHVDLTSPEGGETFMAGDTITIRWVQVQEPNQLDKLFLDFLLWLSMPGFFL